MMATIVEVGTLWAEGLDRTTYGNWMLPIYAGMILVERAFYLLEREHGWPEPESAANIANWILLILFEALAGGALFVWLYLLVYDHRLFTIGFAWWGWGLAFLMNDLAYYASHRLEHRTGLFWAIHMAHHSSQEMNLTVASRNTVLLLSGVSQPLYFLLPFFGLPLPMFLAAKLVGNVWGIFNHTRLVRRMGWLEEALATPANHRVHHGVQAKYLDRNYGQVLILWDRLFGTFQREEEEPIYGLVHQMESRRVYDIQTWGVRWLLGQMRSAKRWSDRVRYLVKPPGWRHDGQHQTTETIRGLAV